MILKRTIQLKRHRQELEPEFEVAAFEEDGPDLVILDHNKKEIARYRASSCASDYQGWITKTSWEPET